MDPSTGAPIVAHTNPGNVGTGIQMVDCSIGNNGYTKGGSGVEEAGEKRTWRLLFLFVASCAIAFCVALALVVTGGLALHDSTTSAPLWWLTLTGGAVLIVCVAYIWEAQNLWKKEEETGVVDLQSINDDPRQQYEILVLKRTFIACALTSIPCIVVLWIFGNRLYVEPNDSDLEHEVGIIGMVLAIVLLLADLLGFFVVGASGLFGLFHEVVTFTLVLILLSHALFGNVLAIFAVLGLRYTQAIQENEDVDDVSVAPFYISIGIGCCAILLAGFGFEGLVTSKLPRAMCILTALSVILTVFIAFLIPGAVFSFRDGDQLYEIIDDNCDVVLQYASEKWLNDEVSCNKYSGTAYRLESQEDIIAGEPISESNIPEPVSYENTAGLDPMCDGGDPIVYAWEYADDGYSGCLNLACCEDLRKYATRSAWLVGSLCIWLSVTMALGVVCAIYLRRHLYIFDTASERIDGNSDDSGLRRVGSIVVEKVVPLTKFDLRILAFFLLAVVIGIIFVPVTFTEHQNPDIVSSDQGSGNVLPGMDDVIDDPMIDVPVTTPLPTLSPTAAPTLVQPSPSVSPTAAPTLVQPSPSESPTPSPTLSPSASSQIDVPAGGLVAHLSWNSDGPGPSDFHAFVQFSVANTGSSCRLSSTVKVCGGVSVAEAECDTSVPGRCVQVVTFSNLLRRTVYHFYAQNTAKQYATEAANVQVDVYVADGQGGAALYGVYSAPTSDIINYDRIATSLTDDSLRGNQYLGGSEFVRLLCLNTASLDSSTSSGQILFETGRYFDYFGAINSGAFENCAPEPEQQCGETLQSGERPVGFFCSQNIDRHFYSCPGGQADLQVCPAGLFCTQPEGVTYVVCDFP